jgi:hypothetical protein
MRAYNALNFNLEARILFSADYGDISDAQDDGKGVRRLVVRGRLCIYFVALTYIKEIHISLTVDGLKF